MFEGAKIRFLATTLLGTVLLFSCAPSPTVSAGEQTAADAQLAAFDKSEPECQLWTNWQKMCSRTGPDGETICEVDEARPVAPSAPFCVGRTGTSPGVLLSALSPDQQLSARRFCDPAPPEGAEATGATADWCPYAKNRPFNGYRLQPRLHAWCNAWSDKSTLEPICSMPGANGNTPDCSVQSQRGTNSEGGLFCSKPQVPQWCDWVEGLQGGPPSAGSSAEYMPIGVRLEGYPVNGIYCRRRK
jgi:hypothetical protein